VKADQYGEAEQGEEAADDPGGEAAPLGVAGGAAASWGPSYIPWQLIKASY
jgi:hypothetical protein